jgi:hypothetical protein
LATLIDMCEINVIGQSSWQVYVVRAVTSAHTFRSPADPLSDHGDSFCAHVWLKGRNDCRQPAGVFSS